jgi:hypothetical protein
LTSLLPPTLGNELWPLEHALNIATSGTINYVLIFELALAPVILILCGIGLCLTLETLAAKLISKLIKGTVFFLSVVYLSLFIFAATIIYFITSMAEHLSFINHVDGPACRPLATLLGSAAAMVLCAFIMFII